MLSLPAHPSGALKLDDAVAPQKVLEVVDPSRWPHQGQHHGVGAHAEHLAAGPVQVFNEFVAAVRFGHHGHDHQLPFH